MAKVRVITNENETGRIAAAKDPEAADKTDVTRLIRLIKAYAPHDGRFEIGIPGVTVYRRSESCSECAHGILQPALCIVTQGAKRVIIGSESYDYDAEHMIVFSVDLPVAAQVTKASRLEPFLCVCIALDPSQIAQLVLKVFPQGAPRAQESRAICLDQTNPVLFNAAVRLVELASQPAEAELLAPLVVDEILIRLLRGPIGARVAQLGVTDSGVHGVAKAVSWLRTNYAEAVKVEDLAKLAHMSPSSFHQHFKAVTSLSPLQYQKALRLQEARRLMLGSVMDAGTAGLEVGYASASQFSREYSRFFGVAPSKDIASLRGQVGREVAES